MTRLLFAGDVLVNDEPSLILKAKGYQILKFRASSDAIALVLEDPPDMLIVDKALPGCMDLLDAARACLQKTNMPILLAVEARELSSLNWEKYFVDDILVKPVDAENLFARIGLAQARMVRVFDNNPLSRLPGNTSILQAIQKTIESGESCGVCYVDIDNFKPYNDRYGFSQGDDVILMVARILVNVMEEMARHKSFVGHVGGDDFLFIIPEDMIDEVCKRVLAHFEVVRNMFLSKEDLEAGCYIEKDRQGRETTFGLLSLSIAVIPTGNHTFSHSAEVSSAASQLKHFVKQKEGSNYVIDRRSTKG
ncbi:MAG: diguanylate cyclase [Proteobacteria bacterium]|nr:diguanylate cyclase [Pseudomonadota bacterium]MBU1639570.1 diguanylate cyclase [Pseudomonadota bacterium]